MILILVLSFPIMWFITVSRTFDSNFIFCAIIWNDHGYIVQIKFQKDYIYVNKFCSLYAGYNYEISV